MNLYKLLTFLIIVLNLFSCKETSKPNENTTVIQNSVVKLDTVSNESITKIKKTPVTKHYEYLFVSARSGLNYSKTPQGKVIGSFPLNKQLKIIEYTNIPDRIKKGDTIINSEWLGVENDRDTVYVLNSFLSTAYTYSDIHVYNITPYYKEKEGTRTAFVNMTETLPHYLHYENYSDDTLILLEENLSKDTIRLNPNQRKKFLQRINVSENDKIFIYELDKDSVHTYDIKHLPVIACVNIYVSSYNKDMSEYDYEFGFDLGKSYTGGYQNFVFVGKENPFQTGKIKTIFWEESDNEKFPIIKETEKNNEVLETMSFSMNNFDYFIQKPIENGRSYHFVVVDKTHNEIAFERHYYSSEGIYLYSLNSEDQSVYTGAIFKNKPPIIYGFTSHSYDCPAIEFIDRTEPPVPVLCDNRH